VHEEVVVFDVNQTLLDLSGLRPAFEKVLSPESIDFWFATMLQNSMVATITRTYASFDEQGVDALISVGRGRGIEIDQQTARKVVAGFEHLAPHSDVVPALELLAGNGIRMAALSNSSTRVLRNQIDFAGLDGYFEALISVEEVGLFKPSPDVYRHAATTLGVGMDWMWMVAAHGWDVVGAMRAGAHGAFVGRQGIVPGFLFEPPEISGIDLIDVAAQIVALDRA
jgi:2-haloacid dehalogenase